MPILREEQYLAAIAGENVTLPSPVLRKEQYLFAIANGEGTIPELPVTREERYLAILAGGEYEIPEPETQLDKYMAKACGLEIEVPTPITRIEQYWAQIAEQSYWKIETLTGSLPLSFLSKGGALSNYRVYGSSEGAGVQTENLVTEIIQNASIGPTGKLTTSKLYNVSIAPITAGTTYTLLRDYTAASLYYAFFTELPATGSVSYDGSRKDVGQLSVTITAPITGYVALMNKNGESTVAEGNTAIPYGYKIPLTETSGVTENAYDKDAKDPENGYAHNRRIAASTGVTYPSSSGVFITEYIAIKPNTNYVLDGMVNSIPLNAASPGICFYNASKEFIRGVSFSRSSENWVANDKQVTSPENAAYARFNINDDSADTAMLIVGSTAPDHYIPYRYTTDYNLYIGDTKLGAEEYLDYQEQKIYRCYSELTLKGDEENLYYYGEFEGAQAFYLDIPENNLSVTGTPYLRCNYYSTAYIAKPAVDKTCRYRWYDSISKWSLGRIYILDNDYTNLSDFRAHLAELYNNGAPLKISYLLKDAPVPTDPPVPFEAIQHYAGENTLSSTETIEQAEITGKIKEVVPNG